MTSSLSCSLIIKSFHAFFVQQRFFTNRIFIFFAYYVVILLMVRTIIKIMAIS
jgi:hypothetical protein